MKRPSFITWDQLRVGGLILAAIVIAGVGIVKLGAATRLFSSRYTLIAFLPNASGLRVGGQVTVAGQLAGTVTAVDFLPVDNDTTRNLRITVELDRAVQAQVRGDSRAKLRTLGLLGDKVFDVSPGTPRFRPLREGDTLQLAPSFDYEQVIQQASGAVTDVVALTRDLRQLTTSIVQGEGTVGQLLTNRELYDQLNNTLTRTGTLLARLQNPRGSVGRLLDDPTLYTNVTRMVASVDTLVTRLNRGGGSAGKLLRDDSLYTRLVRVTAGADSLVRTLSQGDGTVNRLFTDRALYDQLVKAVTGINAVLADIRRDPKRYTKGAIEVF